MAKPRNAEQGRKTKRTRETNPFFFGRTVSGNAFIDREYETERLAETLGRGQSVILFSPRRYGKTSLIQHVIHTLESEGLAVFYLDLYRITSLERFGRHFSQTVLSSFRSPADKLFSITRALIPSLKPKLTYSEPNMPSIEVEMTAETLRKESTLTEMLDFPEKYCAKKDIRGCIVFDEFQEITTFDTDGLLEREMRSAFQHHEHVSYAFLGSKMHLMQDIFKDKNFYNFGDHFELGPIGPEHWVPFITGRFARLGISADDGFAQEIVTMTGGHPYYTQMLCSEIWDLVRHSPSQTLQDLPKTGLQSVLTRENHAFVEIWDSLASNERRLLVALAESGPAQVFSSEFLVNYKLGSASSMQRVVKRLSDRGIITRTEKGYTILDPIFVHWVRREDEEVGR